MSFIAHVRVSKSRLCLTGAASVGALCFLLALGFPAIGTCPTAAAQQASYINWFENTNIVLFGWLAALSGQIGWFANIPFVIISADLLRGRKPKPAALIAQAVLVCIAIVTLAGGMKLPHNEGFSEPVCVLGTGFWLWVCAQTIVFVAALASHITIFSEASSDEL